MKKQSVMSMKKPSAPVKTAAAKAVDNTLTGQNVLAQTIHSETYTGPIPHPDILKKYDDVKSGLAERIVKMAEREQEYRIDTSRREEEQKEKVIDIAANESDQFIKAQKWGQWIGAAISGSCIIIPLVLALLGYGWEIVTPFLAVPTASLIAAFMPRKGTERLSASEESGEKKQDV